MLIVRGHSMRVVIHEFFKNPALIILAGSISLILGLLFVLAHNVWEWSWRLLVTLLSYIVLIRGIIHLYLPEWIKEMAHKHFEHVQSFRILGLILAILGVFLIVCTFFENTPPIFNIT